MNAIRLLLVDANITFVRILADFLQQQEDMKVVGIVCNGREAVQQVRDLKPDVVLIDPRMPGQIGQAVIGHLRETLPGMRIIVLTLFDQDTDRMAALDAGADDLISKARVTNTLVPALRQVAFHNLQPIFPLN